LKSIHYGVVLCQFIQVTASKHYMNIFLCCLYRAFWHIYIPCKSIKCTPAMP